MRNTILFGIIIIILSFNASIVVGVPLDFVVMVDTSNSMEIYFDDLVDYIITDILKKNLRPGDSFHLIRFSELPVHELTQVITDKASTDAILKKISFLKGKLLFGKYTDILASLKFLILYAEGLSKRNNKKLLLLSDFINNPSKSSPYSGISLDELEQELIVQARTIHERNGWSIHFIRFPSNRFDDSKSFDDASQAQDLITRDPVETSRDDTKQDEDVPGIEDTLDKNLSLDEDAIPVDDKDTPGPGDDDSKEQDVLDIISDTFNVDIPTYEKNGKDDPAIKKSGFPRLEFPGYLGRHGRVFHVPFIIHNYLDDDIIIKLNTLEHEGKNILAELTKPRPKFVEAGGSKKFKVKIQLPADIDEGPNDLPIVLTFDDDYRIAPREGIISFYYTGDIWVNFFRIIGVNLPLITSILIVVSILLLIFIFIRMRVFEGVFSDLFTTSEWSKGVTTIPDGEGLIEMRVAFQNPHVGYRNIHKIDDNKTVTIGGGFSTFLIFLIPMPSHIAEIENRDGTYIFHPVKMEFFPDLKGPVENCLNKDIPVVSKHGYRTQITFKEYESPLSRLNKLLHSVRQEG